VGLVKPETIEVTHADLVAIHMTRSDQDVANFFLPEVTLAQPWLGSNYHKAMLAQDDPWLYVRHHLNCHPELYGDRKLSATLRQGYPGFKVAQNSRKAAEHAVHEGTLIDWAKRRREALARLNRDNSVWENGSLTLRGNERLKAGRYLRLLRGVVEQEAYMTAVTHNFMPYRSYTTQAHVIRGDGWLRRQRMQDRPALLERAGGLYR
jgi:hypothetical protein